MKEIERHIRQNNLVSVKDTESNRNIYRRKTEFPIKPLTAMEDRVSDFLNAKREKANITREEMSELLGLSQQVYGRYERRLSHLRVSRFLHIAEVLGIEMLDVLAYAAPQLFGDNEIEAKARAELVSAVLNLPAKNMFEVSSYVRLLAQLIQNEKYEADREAVLELTELMEKNGLTNSDMAELIAAKKAKRAPRKPRKSAGNAD